MSDDPVHRYVTVSCAGCGARITAEPDRYGRVIDVGGCREATQVLQVLSCHDRNAPDHGHGPCLRPEGHGQRHRDRLGYEWDRQ